MKNFKTILKFTYCQKVKSKAFILTTLAAVLLMALVVNFNTIKENFMGDSQKEIAFCDYDNGFGLTEETFDGIISDQYKYKIIDNNRIDEVKDSIRSKKSDFDYLVTLYSKDKEEIEIYTKSNTDTVTIAAIGSYLKNMYANNRALKFNVDINEINNLMSDVPVNFETVNEEKLGNTYLVYVLMIVLYIVIMFYGSIVSNSIIEEKNNRIMETLITMCKPMELYFGKIIGVCTVCLTQLFIIIGSGVVFMSFNNDFNEFINEFDINLDTRIVIYLIIFSILGYFMYSFIYGAMGSLVSSTQDSTQAMLPMTFLIFVIFMIGIESLNNIDSTLVIALSYIPFSSPMIMFERIVLSDVPLINILISIVILLLSIFSAGFLSSKVYARGVLHYGKKASYFKILFNKE